MANPKFSKIYGAVLTKVKSDKTVLKIIINVSSTSNYSTIGAFKFKWPFQRFLYTKDFYNHYSSIMTILTELESVKWTKLNIYFKHIHTSFLVLAEKGKNGPEK